MIGEEQRERKEMGMMVWVPGEGVVVNVMQVYGYVCMCNVNVCIVLVYGNFSFFLLGEGVMMCIGVC